MGQDENIFANPDPNTLSSMKAVKGT